MVLPCLRNQSFDSSIRTGCTNQSQLIIGEVEDLSNQACVPIHLRQPHKPTAMEIAEHQLSHMPYTSV
eukprot:6491735-Amphidinium_carterae.2